MWQNWHVLTFLQGTDPTSKGFWRYYTDRCTCQDGCSLPVSSKIIVVLNS